MLWTQLQSEKHSWTVGKCCCNTCIWKFSRSTLKHIGIPCFNPVIVWKTGRLLHFIIHHQQKTCHRFYSLMLFISKILHTFPFLFADIEIRVVAYCVYTCTDTRQPLLLCCFFVHTKCSCSAVYIIFILRVQVRYRSEINIHWKSLIFTGNRFNNLKEKYLLSVRSEVSFINLLWLTLNIVLRLNTLAFYVLIRW